MLTLFLIGFCIFAIFIAGMAIGVFFGKKPIKGSCGGLGKIMGKRCPHCQSTTGCKKEKTQTSTKKKRETKEKARCLKPRVSKSLTI